MDMFPIYQVLYCIESCDDRFLNAIVVANQKLLNGRRHRALVNQSTVIVKVSDRIILDRTPSDDTYLRRRQVFLSLNRSLLVFIERAVFRGDDVGRGGIVSFNSTRPSCPSVSAQFC